MTIDTKSAFTIVKKNFPKAKIQRYIEYEDLYIFQLLTGLPFEEGLDPFYSVDKTTGEFKDYSIFDDATGDVITLLQNTEILR